MSMWTHILAAIDVDTFKSRDDIKEYIEFLLRTSPEISGSEGAADIFVNVLSGHNIFTNCDCNRCKDKDTIIHKDKGFSCESEDGFKCPHGEYQTRVIITVIGDLRDRNMETTQKEYENFIEYIKKECRFLIRNEAVKIIC